MVGKLGIDAAGTEMVAIAKAAEERIVGTASRKVAVDTATEGGGSIKEIWCDLLKGQKSTEWLTIGSESLSLSKKGVGRRA